MEFFGGDDIISKFCFELELIFVRIVKQGIITGIPTLAIRCSTDTSEVYVYLSDGEHHIRWCVSALSIRLTNMPIDDFAEYIFGQMLCTGVSDDIKKEIM